MTNATTLPVGIVDFNRRGAARWEQHLDRRAVLSLSAATVQSLACLDGTLWITSDRVAGDVILRPGMRFRQQVGEALTIQALVASRFAIAPG